MASERNSAVDAAAMLDEQKRLRRLRLVVDLTASLLSQEPALTPEKGLAMIERAEHAIEGLFPGSNPQFDLLVRPRFLRILEERFPPDPKTIN